jgi:hypothetical protein
MLDSRRHILSIVIISLILNIVNSITEINMGGGISIIDERGQYTVVFYVIMRDIFRGTEAGLILREEALGVTSAYEIIVGGAQALF